MSGGSLGSPGTSDTEAEEQTEEMDQSVDPSAAETSGENHHLAEDLQAEKGDELDETSRHSGEPLSSDGMDGVEGLKELEDSQSETEVDGEDVTEGSVVQYGEETSEDVVQVAESDTEEEGSSDSQMTMTVDEQELEERAAPEGNAGQMAWMLGLHPEGGNADSRGSGHAVA